MLCYAMLNRKEGGLNSVLISNILEFIMESRIFFSLEGGVFSTVFKFIWNFTISGFVELFKQAKVSMINQKKSPIFVAE